MIQKINIDAVLQRIANTMILNTRKTYNTGLLEGKMGIALFLLHYSRISENILYSEYAEELLDEISDKAGVWNRTIDFTNGSTGVVWGIINLIKNKLINADEDVLEEVEISLNNSSDSGILYDIDNKCPFFSKGIYFLNRNNKEEIKNLLNELILLLNQNNRALPLSYLNSILYTLLNGCDDLKISINILEIIYVKIIDSISNDNCTFPDILLLTEIIEQLKQKSYAGYDYKKWGDLLNRLDYDNLTGIFNIGLYKLIFNKIEFNDSLISNKLETIYIEDHVNSIIRDVYRNLSLFNGLTGVGLTLIDYFAIIKQYSIETI